MLILIIFGTKNKKIRGVKEFPLFSFNSIMNGKKYKLSEVREHLEFMSELGYKFKRLPSYDNIIKFQAKIGDDMINTYEYEIRGTSLKRLFSLCNAIVTA